MQDTPRAVRVFGEPKGGQVRQHRAWAEMALVEQSWGYRVRRVEGEAEPRDSIT